MLGGVFVGNHATQVTVSNNIFLGFSKECAIIIGGGRRVTVTGNHIDLTRLEGGPDNERCGIQVEASNVPGRRQPHLRPAASATPKATGVHIADDAVNVHLHDNIIEKLSLRPAQRTPETTWRRMARGASSSSTPRAEVEAVTGARSLPGQGHPAPPADSAAPYRGWQLRWLGGVNTGKPCPLRATTAAPAS